jgi:hypothetical protein
MLIIMRLRRIALASSKRLLDPPAPIMRIQRAFTKPLHRVSTDSYATGFPRTRPTRILPRRQTRRAQANSLARIAKPSGTTMNAGPGRTIRASPIRTTLKPRVPTRNFRSRGCASNPKRAIHFCNQRFRKPPFFIFHRINRALPRDECFQFLFKVRGHMRGDHSLIAVVLQVEDAADAMNFRNQVRFA